MYDDEEKVNYSTPTFIGDWFERALRLLQMGAQMISQDVDDDDVKLTVELVPHPLWQKNVRALTTQAQWDFIRFECYDKAKWVCEICGGVGPTYPVACHEVFEYDDAARLQTLKGVQALCPMCHSVKHLGLAQRQGLWDDCIAHMLRVNGWTHAQSVKYLSDVFHKNDERNFYTWTQDLTWLDTQLQIFGNLNSVYGPGPDYTSEYYQAASTGKIVPKRSDRRKDVPNDDPTKPRLNRIKRRR